MGKKLIEVALPLEAINRACEQDKDRKTGHIRNLHKWFAPMPLPAWRVALFASLVDDPSEYLEDQAAQRERERLFEIIRRLLPFEAIRDEGIMTDARAEIWKSMGGDLPVVLDPFCGGGSTCVEAQRLGLPSIASDLNPVPVLITLMLTALPPFLNGKQAVNPVDRSKRLVASRGLQGFVADVHYYAEWIREGAWRQIGRLYPAGASGDPVIAWRWARTVISPDPASRGARTPLISDWWLSKRKSGKVCIIPVVRRQEQAIDVTVAVDGNPPDATIGRTGGRCLFSGTPIPLKYIRSEGKSGRLGLQLLTIVTSSKKGQHYLPPDIQQEEVAASAQPAWQPDGQLPDRALGFRVQEYGITRYSQLFTNRQLLALGTFASLIAAVRERVLEDALAAGLTADRRPFAEGGSGAQAYADGVVTMLGLCLGKLVQANNMLVRWFIDPRNGLGKAVQSFDRHALPMVWDFVETNPFGGSVGDWVKSVVPTALRSLDLVAASGPPAQVFQLDAQAVGQVIRGGALIATDPPYYGNIGYADLSDFFYVWLRKALRETHPSLFATVLTPKESELIATPFRHGGKKEAANQYFRSRFEQVFLSLARLSKPGLPIAVVYAFKQQEEKDGGAASTGWEVMLDALLSAGLAVVGTWPIRTARAARMIGVRTNALTSAILIVCRPKQGDSPLATRREFINALRKELPDALRKLQHGNIAPVDLAQAAIGPGMAVFSRYAKVLEADGSPMRVRTALALINQALDEVLAEQESEFDSDTRWALAWFEQHAMEESAFGEAETLSRAKNTSVQGMVEAGILTASAGKVRLLKREELPEDWDPATDRRLTIWEVSQHLIRALDQKGEQAAADLLRKVGGLGETARDLAYRVYSICERKKWAQEALAYNSLVTAWPEMQRLARGEAAATQAALKGTF